MVRLRVRLLRVLATLYHRTKATGTSRPDLSALQVKSNLNCANQSSLPSPLQHHQLHLSSAIHCQWSHIEQACIPHSHAANMWGASTAAPAARLLENHGVRDKHDCKLRSSCSNQASPQYRQLQVLPASAHLTTTLSKTGLAELPNLGTALSVAPTKASPTLRSKAMPSAEATLICEHATTAQRHSSVLANVGHLLPSCHEHRACHRMAGDCTAAARSCGTTSTAFCARQSWTIAAFQTTLTRGSCSMIAGSHCIARLHCLALQL